LPSDQALAPKLLQRKMTTIDVQGRYFVRADDSLGFTDETAFRFAPSGTAAPSQLINAGAISASFSADGIGIFGDSDQGPAVFWNKAGATLSVSGGASTVDATSGFVLTAPGSLLRNDGLISVASETSATSGWLVSSRIVNNGDIQVHSATAGGFGVITGGAQPEIVNHGLIHASGVDAIGLFMLGQTRVVNTGQIMVEGSGDVVALAGSDAGPNLRNSGLIQAVNTDGSDARAIVFGSGYGAFDLDNSGRIVADHAIFVGDPLAIALHISNSGEIDGTVSLGGGDDLLHNTGSIVGDIDLGQGADGYFGQRSDLDVTVYGAGHADSLYGGAGDDLLYGDRQAADFYDGADLLKGGHGHDSLHGGGGADTLVGGAGGDELTGDAGSDVFLFAKISDSAWSAPDLITDLEASDVIDLSAIDADTTQAGDQAFHLVHALSGQAGEAVLAYDRGSHSTRLELDVNGDGHADAVIAIDGDARGFTGLVL
jgi:Ca2+-binding RTX toxin-like protein